jgi:creatinine amidohydrolase
VRDASARGRALRAGLPGDPIDGVVALLAGGAHVARSSHLSRKLLEGLLVPWPPVWDLLDFAHGAFQQLYAGRATLLALARADAPEEGPLFARAASMLDPARHRWLRLEARLPGPFALVEHECMANELLLAALEARGGDPSRWPGQGRDAPLYAVAEAPAPAREAPTRSLAALSWPELEGLLASGARTAVVPLGSTEQHGPHLPYATDTLVAEALAARFCARVPEAVALPALPLGCADEHLGFPGTLSLRRSTLGAVLADLLACLDRHGFERAFVLSGHGGNARLLAELEPRLDAEVALDVIAFTDHAALAEALFREAAARGVAPGAAGHHAGEIETSILLAIAPADVRLACAAPGLLEVPRDAQAVFYPDLRANAPSGVVGDPADASAGRAAAYLDVWVDLLVERYERAKKRPKAKGTKKA